MMVTQFHDCLPGSSVGEVYEELAPIQEKISNFSIAKSNEIAQFILSRMNLTNFQRPALFVNTLGFARTELFNVEGRKVRIELPSAGWTVVDLANEQRSSKHNLRTPDQGAFVREDGEHIVLENHKLKILFAKNGLILEMVI